MWWSVVQQVVSNRREFERASCYSFTHEFVDGPPSWRATCSVEAWLALVHAREKHTFMLMQCSRSPTDCEVPMKQLGFQGLHCKARLLEQLAPRSVFVGLALVAATTGEQPALDGATKLRIRRIVQQQNAILGIEQQHASCSSLEVRQTMQGRPQCIDVARVVIEHKILAYMLLVHGVPRGQKCVPGRPHSSTT